MTPKEQSTQLLIIGVTKTLITETDDIEKITVRQIAKQANVGIGLINYHFKSKDNLLSLAIGDTMSDIISNFSQLTKEGSFNPIETLKAMLKELYSLSDKKEKIMHFILSRDIMNGNMRTPSYLLPLLKQIFGDKKNDTELKVIALQILYPIQVTGLNHDSFYSYSGIDLADKNQRTIFIDTLINNLIDNS
ncbi:TetR/AcrR family transcriptional regulator [Scatolibacter rhodanostii]|uniref:TetR/AcrR family transcriptional regulator n=1 Tax=Scatolibacter rhodanostii TaxID=2014781 RepID=UPI000C08C3D2|nr:TetR/AcrR family transcriptional regulator [Scatolibacter rhodanostii]